WRLTFAPRVIHLITGRKLRRATPSRTSISHLIAGRKLGGAPGTRRWSAPIAHLVAWRELGGTARCPRRGCAFGLRISASGRGGNNSSRREQGDLSHGFLLTYECTEKASDFGKRSKVPSAAIHTAPARAPRFFVPGGNALPELLLAKKASA